MSEGKNETRLEGAEEITGTDDNVEVSGETLGREAYRDVVLTSGETVRCFPVSPLLIQRVTTAKAAPEPPVKTVTNAAGIEETYVDFEDKEYLRKTEKAEGEQREVMQDLLLLRGLKEVRFPENFAWSEELGFFGLEFVTEGVEGRLAYIKYALLDSTYDLMLVIRTITEISGASEQAIKRVMADFQ